MSKSQKSTPNIKSSRTSGFSIWWRRLIHRPLVAVFKLSGIKVKLLRNDFIPNDKPTIFASTHVFYDDIASVLSSLQTSAYVLIGAGERETFPSFPERIVLGLNGAIILDRGDKRSRVESFDKMVNVLRCRGDILVFPESAWNFSPNAIVAHLNWGVLRVAEHTGANIVPVAVNIVGDNYCVIIGNHFEYESYASHQETIDALRDAMATLAWEIITLNPPIHRDVLTDAYWLKHIQKQYAKRRLRQDRTKEESYMYRPKDEISLGELLADLHGIEYKSMAVDYEQYRRIERLIENWTKPIKFRG